MTEYNGNKTDESEENEKKAGKFFELSRKVLLASIGAAVIAQDELSNFVDHLAERGEIAEKDGRKLVKELIERREKMMHEKGDEIHHWKRNIATRSDVEALNAKIAELSKKLDEMKAQSAKEEK